MHLGGDCLRSVQVRQRVDLRRASFSCLLNSDGVDGRYDVYYTYLRRFNGTYNDENEILYISYDHDYYSGGYGFWNPANASTMRPTTCAVRLIRLLDKAPGY